jgi:hypothetical protein
MNNGNESKNALSVATTAASRPVTAVDYFGGCPECGYHDGYLNVGRVHWFICHEHRTRWCVGDNLFSSWRSETAQQFLENQRRIGGYRIVEPLQPAECAGACASLPSEVLGALKQIVEVHQPAAEAAYLRLPDGERAGHMCESLALVYGWLNGIAEPIRWMRMQLGLHRRSTTSLREASHV